MHASKATSKAATSGYSKGVAWKIFGRSWICIEYRFYERHIHGDLEELDDWNHSTHL